MYWVISEKGKEILYWVINKKGKEILYWVITKKEKKILYWVISKNEMQFLHNMYVLFIFSCLNITFCYRGKILMNHNIGVIAN